MNANKIETGKVYKVTVGKNTTVVKVTVIERRVNGSLVFHCENVKTGKPMVVADCERFRKEVKPEKKASNPIGNAAKKITNVAVGSQMPSASPNPAPDGRLPETVVTETQTERVKRERPDGTVSGLEAALIVLKESGEALNIKQIMERINERNLARLEGKTPESTVSAAIQRDLVKKGENSRFEKAGKGLFRAK